jgi:hypothetical protein
MAVIEAIVFIGAAGIGLIIVCVIVVIIGVRQEERRLTVVRGHRPPTACALVARRILGAHFYLIPRERPEVEGPEEEPPWFQRPVPPKHPVGPRGR